jgi:hypothetical protein
MSRNLALLLFTPGTKKAGAASSSNLRFDSFALEDSRQGNEQLLNQGAAGILFRKSFRQASSPWDI